MSVPTSTSEKVRARRWNEYIGQARLKSRLMIHIRAAIAENRELDHMLLVAPPGAGKSTLAELIAQELRDPFHSIQMPVKERDFLYFVMDWPGGVLLLDEIHSAPKGFQELLLGGVQDGMIQAASGRKVDVRHITFIAATTEPEAIIKPLWDRFLIKPQWEPYSDDEMGEIVAGMASRAGVAMPPDVARGLARAAGGTPRIAGSLVVACRSLIAVGETPTVSSILDLAEMDIDGLTSRHMAYLRSLAELGGVAGLSSLCSMMQLSQSVVEDLERLLIQRNFIRKDTSGRNLTEQGRQKVPSYSNKPSFERRRKARMAS
jgi:holliday junction DNA helicase RuvB